LNRKHAGKALALTITPTVVRKYCQPYLSQRGLHVKTGRPPVDKRNAFIHRRLAEGVSWAAIRGEIARSEGVKEKEIPSKASLQRAYYRARRSAK
jgi:hypothetical protein